MRIQPLVKSEVENQKLLKKQKILRRVVLFVVFVSVFYFFIKLLFL